MLYAKLMARQARNLFLDESVLLLPQTPTVLNYIIDKIQPLFIHHTL